MVELCVVPLVDGAGLLGGETGSLGLVDVGVVVGWRAAGSVVGTTGLANVVGADVVGGFAVVGDVDDGVAVVDGDTAADGFVEPPPQPARSTIVHPATDPNLTRTLPFTRHLP